MTHKTRVENGQDKSRSVPSRFLHLTGLFSYFWTNSESIRNTGCQIRKRDRNGLACIPIVFVFPVFDRDIPFSLIRDIPFFQLKPNQFQTQPLRPWCPRLPPSPAASLRLSLHLPSPAASLALVPWGLDSGVQSSSVVASPSSGCELWLWLCTVICLCIFMYSCRVCWMTGHDRTGRCFRFTFP